MSFFLNLSRLSKINRSRWISQFLSSQNSISTNLPFTLCLKSWINRYPPSSFLFEYHSFIRLVSPRVCFSLFLKEEGEGDRLWALNRTVRTRRWRYGAHRETLEASTSRNVARSPSHDVLRSRIKIDDESKARAVKGYHTIPLVRVGRIGLSTIAR